MKVPVTNISFNKEAVKHMTVERFITEFSETYPDADLSAYAKTLGLVNEPVTPNGAPAYSGPGLSDDKKPKGGKI